MLITSTAECAIRPSSKTTLRTFGEWSKYINLPIEATLAISSLAISRRVKELEFEEFEVILVFIADVPHYISANGSSKLRGWLHFSIVLLYH